MTRYILEYSYVENMGQTLGSTKEMKIPLDAETDEEARKKAKALLKQKVAEAENLLEIRKKTRGNSNVDDFGDVPRNAWLVRKSSL